MDEPAVVRWGDVVPQPWRNGSGVTRELLSAGADASSFDWRISVADVDASGDFSSFVGVDRVIVLVDGPAMTLTVDGVRRELNRFEPYAFDGGVPASCEVPLGPTRDLNVMTTRGRCQATVEVMAVDGPTVCDAGRDAAHLFIPLAGEVSIAREGSDALLLNRFDLLRVRPGPVTFHGHGRVARVEIS